MVAYDQYQSLDYSIRGSVDAQEAQEEQIDARPILQGRSDLCQRRGSDDAACDAYTQSAGVISAWGCAPKWSA